MKSAQESKNELEAAIRYAENAISSAKQTIESMEFRQEMAKKQHSEQTGREEVLQREVAELKIKLVESENRSMEYTKEIEDLKEDLKEQKMFDQEVRDAVKDFVEQLGTIGFEGV